MNNFTDNTISKKLSKAGEKLLPLQIEIYSGRSDEKAIYKCILQFLLYRIVSIHVIKLLITVITYFLAFLLDKFASIVNKLQYLMKRASSLESLPKATCKIEGRNLMKYLSLF